MVGVLVIVTDHFEVILVDFTEVDLLSLAGDVDAPSCLFLNPHDHTMLKPSSQDVSLVDLLAVLVLEAGILHELQDSEVDA